MPAASPVVRHIARDRVGSTNDEAFLLAAAGETGPFWLTARSQSAGRGRRGRTWASPPGNLYATVLLPNPSPPARAPELSFVAALAVHDAIGAVAPGCRPMLKWPNDVLLDGRKCAGILVEGRSAGDAFTVAVGVGVNCADHPAATAHPATDLAAAGFDVPPERLFPELARAFARRLAQWQEGRGFAAIRADWTARADALGGAVRVRLPDRDLAGTFRGLDEGGRLVLEGADGTREIVAAGDVVGLGETATPRPAGGS